MHCGVSCTFVSFVFVEAYPYMNAFCKALPIISLVLCNKAGYLTLMSCQVIINNKC